MKANLPKSFSKAVDGFATEILSKEDKISIHKLVQERKEAEQKYLIRMLIGYVI